MNASIGDSVLRSVSTAMSDLSRANELSRYMEMFISEQKFEVGEIGHVSFRDSLYSALERTGLSSTNVQIGKEVQSIELKMEQDCSVQANSFLSDAFQYILEGISKRIGQFQDLSINISESATRHNYCTCDMQMDIHVEEPNEILGLFERYIEGGPLEVVEIAYSKSIVSLLGGLISMSASKSGDNIVSIFVRIQLKMSE
jgi:hypothetical protein